MLISALNTAQKGFLIRFSILTATLTAGLILKLIAKGQIAGMETTADMNVFSLLGMFSGMSIMIAMPIIAIVTLRYGRRHEADIREHAILSRLLTVYRVLFWLTVIGILITVIGLIWFATHLGPVRRTT